MNKYIEQFWHSGEWKEQNNDKIPYNGIEIKAKSNYEADEKTPSVYKLTSVEVTVSDYTKNPKGVSSIVNLSRTGVWYDIPIPKNTSVLPPQPDTDFTLRGIYLGSLGKLQLQSNSVGYYLRIQFCYGLEGQRREELGFAIVFSKIYK